MVNKSLYASLDAHLDKVKGSAEEKSTTVKNVALKKVKKTKTKKPKGKFYMHLEKIKNYLFPGTVFEEFDLTNLTDSAVVKTVDQGIHKHIKLVKKHLKTKFNKTETIQEEVYEEPDLDVSKVNAVIKNNRI